MRLRASGNHTDDFFYNDDGDDDDDDGYKTPSKCAATVVGWGSLSSTSEQGGCGWLGE